VSAIGFPRRMIDRLVRGGGAKGRARRYVLTGVAGAAAIWILAIAYLVLTPKSYTSSFTLVLPGTGAGASVNIDNLGQASSTSTSAFSSPDMSPTENYRKIMMSHRVLWAAANILNVPEPSLPKPRIELAEQTKLIIVSVAGPTAEIARQRSSAFQKGFLDTLDALRADELAMRDATTSAVLDAYRKSLDQARERLIAHQVKSGLVSLEQYNSIVTSVEHLREQLQDIDARLAQATAGVDSLTHILGTDADAANVAMVLRADPVFQTGLDQMAKDDADIAALTGTRVPAA